MALGSLLPLSGEHPEIPNLLTIIGGLATPIVLGQLSQTLMGLVDTMMVGRLGEAPLAAVAVATLLWGDLGNRYVWIVLLTTLAFGAVGMWDDYRKLVLRDSRGLAARWKYLWQSLFGLAAAVALYGSAALPAETRDGHPVRLSANMEMPQELEYIRERGGDCPVNQGCGD